MSNVYCIVLINDITNDMIEEAINEAEFLRYSLDGSKAILKFSTPFPNSMKGYIKYSVEELIIILGTAEWSAID